MTGPSDDELIAAVVGLAPATAWSVHRSLYGLATPEKPSLQLVARRLGRLAREGRIERSYGDGESIYQPIG